MVRKALRELGPDATDQQVKTYLKANAPQVPQNQIGLVLRRLRESAGRTEK
jgi:hypothetical protein